MSQPQPCQTSVLAAALAIQWDTCSRAGIDWSLSPPDRTHAATSQGHKHVQAGKAAPAYASACACQRYQLLYFRHINAKTLNQAQPSSLRSSLQCTPLAHLCAHGKLHVHPTTVTCSASFRHQNLKQISDCSAHPRGIPDHAGDSYVGASRGALPSELLAGPAAAA